MRRLPLWALLGLLILAILGLAVAFRGAVIEIAVESYLADQGFPETDVEIVDLGLEQAIVLAPTLGPDGPSADRIVITYQTGEILDGRVRDIRIEGLRLSIDLSEAAPLGRFTELAGDSGGGGAKVPGPKIVLDDAEILLTGMAAGDIAIALGGAIDLSGEAVGAQLDGQVTTDHSRAIWTVTGADLPDGPRLVIAGTVESDLSRIPWPAGLGPAPQAGRALLAIDGAFPVPWGEGLTVAAVLAQAGSLNLDLRLYSVSIPGYATDVDVAARVAVETGDGILSLRLVKPVTISAGEIEADALRRLGREAAPAQISLAALAPDRAVFRWSAAAGGRVALAVDATLGQDSARLHIEGEVADDHIEVAGPLQIDLARLAAGDWTADDVAFEGPLRFAWDADGIVVESTAPGTLSLGKPPQVGALRLTGPVQVAVDNMRFFQIEDRMEIAAVLDPGTVAGEIMRDRGGDLDFVVKPGSVGFSIRKSAETTGEFRLQGGEARFPAWGLRIANVEATIPFDTGKDPGRVSAEIHPTAAPAAFAPLGVAFEVSGVDATWRVTGQAKLLGHRVSLPFAGRYDAAGGTGKLALGPGRLEFRSGGLQPADLSRHLAEFGHGEGAVKVEATFTLDPKKGVRGRARAAFDGFSVDTPAGRIEGLSGAVDFNRVMPPTTAPRQKFKIAKLNAALPLEDISIVWHLGSESGKPVIGLDHVEARLAGGLVVIDNAMLRPGAPSSAVELRLERLSLGRMFEDLDIEALSGTGALSGTIPVRFGAAGVVIENSLLRAEEAGVLRVRLGATKQVLEGQGEQVALMVQALENFHYKILEVRIDRPPGGQLAMGVLMEGRNPDVMEGHPFRFNISLSGELEPVLSALHDGRALTTDLLRRAME